MDEAPPISTHTRLTDDEQLALEAALMARSAERALGATNALTLWQRAALDSGVRRAPEVTRD